MEQITVVVWIGKYVDGRHWCQTAFWLGRHEAPGNREADHLLFGLNHKRTLALRLLRISGSYERLEASEVDWQRREYGVYTVPDGTWDKLKGLTRVVRVSKAAMGHLLTAEDILGYIDENTIPPLASK